MEGVMFSPGVNSPRQLAQGEAALAQVADVLVVIPIEDASAPPIVQMRTRSYRGAEGSKTGTQGSRKSAKAPSLASASFNDCAMAPSQPLLEARGVTNRFRGVEALKGVDIDVHADSVIALLGDNGAGNLRW
jgi:ATPase subunit of ABC transporter with duplicated ATPase domains